MIVKILSSASANFHGVQYNDKKVKKGKGELMAMKNFPSFITDRSSQQQVRDYFKAISSNNKTKKPQFHAVISTRFRQHSKEDLTRVAGDFMEQMGYGKQPYIVVFHSDTENNHVHIVSTRVEKESGKKINDSFEKLRSQRALDYAMEKNFGVKAEVRIENYLAYQFTTIEQMKLVFERAGMKVLENKKNPEAIDIVKKGVVEKTISLNQIPLLQVKKDNRSRQIKAILEKYATQYSNKVFKVVDNRETEGLYEGNRKMEPKIEYESELQHRMRERFGIDIVFHFKDNKQPFGYTLIDHATQKVYKGSDVMKMNNLFSFTTEKIDKRDFEKLKEYSFLNESERQAFLRFLQKEKDKINIKDYMLFGDNAKKQTKEQWREISALTRAHLENPSADSPVNIFQGENGKMYVIHEQIHQIHELEFLLEEQESERAKRGTEENILSEGLEGLIKNLNTSSYAKAEDEMSRRRRRKRR